MGLIRLGDLIEQTDIRNTDSKFKADDLKGISINKALAPTKADTNDLDVLNYKVLKNDEFVYCTVTSRNGNKISLAYNDGAECIVSSINPTFKIKDENKLLPRYLMMFFNRPEFDRYARFNSWGSARETFSWDDMCDIELYVPPIDIQKKYVAVYEALLDNLHTYEEGLDDLKLVCDGYIEDLRKKYPLENIFNLLTQRREKNEKLLPLKMYGIGLNGIIPPNQNRDDDSKKRCVLFYKGDLLYAPSSFKNGVIVYNNKIDIGIISEEYRVFYVNNSRLNPQYLLMWLKRSELGRYIEFYTLDSVRNRFQFEELSIVQIPIPPLELQDSIVEIFNAYNKRKEFIDRLKKMIRDICPVLVKGAIDEAEQREGL